MFLIIFLAIITDYFLDLKLSPRDWWWTG